VPTLGSQGAEVLIDNSTTGSAIGENSKVGARGRCGLSTGIQGTVAQKLPVGVGCAKFYKVSLGLSFFPYLKATLDLHRRAEGAGFGGNLGVMDQMKLSVKSVLKTYASECFGNDKGDDRTPFCSIVEELDCQGTHATEGGIADYENVLEACLRRILKEVFS
jgi:hypothetical protein